MEELLAVPQQVQGPVQESALPVQLVPQAAPQWNLQAA